MNSRSLMSENIWQDVHEIDNCLTSDNRWSVLRKYTKAKDLQDVKNMCMGVNADFWPFIYVFFFDEVQKAWAEKPPEILERDKNLSDDWYHEPVYYTYPQFFGTDDRETPGTFDHLTRMLDYLEEAGVKNLFLLPHYKSPMGDGGYDVSDYSPREDLGGWEAYHNFMKKAVEKGFRIMTDLPVNHTSIRHTWFQEALLGDERKLNFYLQRTGRRKIGEEDRNGDIFVQYYDPDGIITERILIFPDVTREHYREFEINGRKVQIYQEFYPFQLDLDLQNPDVLREIFILLGREANEGILGKRTDAVAHWIKKPGTTADGLPETHAVHALFKSFFRHVSPKGIILPEAVRGAAACAEYCGVETKIVGGKTTSEGDALFDFDLQGALREMIYRRTTKPFWNKVYEIPELPDNATWLNLLGHHDETYMGMITPENREKTAIQIARSGGFIYKNKMSAGCRYADVLEHNPERIASAIFALYLMPGVPVIYYGVEIGAGNNYAHAGKMQMVQHGILTELGMEVPVRKCYDPRELQRGPIPEKAFAITRDTGYLPYTTWKKLNGIRAERPTLGSIYLTPIHNGHDEVLSMIKFTKDGTDEPLLGIINLSDEEKTARIPYHQLRGKMNLQTGEELKLADLLTDKSEPLELNIVDKHILLTLPSNGRMLISKL